MDFKIKFKKIGKKIPAFEYEFKDIDSSKFKTLRDLIESLVIENVKNYNDKVENQTIDFLTASEIDEQANDGKIFNEEKDLKKANTLKAIDNALLSFEDGIYKVFIDENEVSSLDEVIIIHNDSEVIFIKLTMLSSSFRWW